MVSDMAVAVIMDLDTNMAVDMVLTTAMLYFDTEDVIYLVYPKRIKNSKNIRKR